jgi:outer membrane protein W
MALACTVSLVAGVAYPAKSHAYALADAALLKFYGGFIAPDETQAGYRAVSGTPQAFSRPNNNQVIGFDADYDSDIMYGVAIEYFFADHWSVELAYEQHSSDLDNPSLDVLQSPTTFIRSPINTDGELELTVYALNVYYNFGAIGRSKVQPYLGLGYVHGDETIIDIAGLEFQNDGQDGIQYIAGLALHLSQTWNIFFDYRNLALDEINLAHRTAGTILDFEYETEVYLIGLSLEF